MKGILEFELPEERDEFNTAFKSSSYIAALHEIRNSLFRPARKHGYAAGSVLGGVVTDYNKHVVEALESEFNRILNEYEINDI